MALGDNIRYLREHRGWTQKELGDRLDISDKAVSTWENNTKIPRLKTLQQIADLFEVNLTSLINDRPMALRKNTAERQATVSQGGNTHFSRTLDRLCLSASKPPARVARDMAIPWERFLTLLHGEEPPSKEELGAFAAYFQVPPSTFRPTPAGIKSAAPAPRQPQQKSPLPLAETPAAPSNPEPRLTLMQPQPVYGRIPVLGRIPAGVPVEAVEDVIDYIDLPDRLSRSDYAYFSLLVTGNSMYPEYMDGDIVIVRQQNVADTGDDVVAYIGGYDATLKRLTITPGGLQLRPLNAAYEVRSFTNEEILRLPVTIAGGVVEQRRRRKT